jgi:hypothetical protein
MTTTGRLSITASLLAGTHVCESAAMSNRVSANVRFGAGNPDTGTTGVGRLPTFTDRSEAATRCSQTLHHTLRQWSTTPSHSPKHSREVGRNLCRESPVTLVA